MLDDRLGLGAINELATRNVIELTLLSHVRPLFSPNKNLYQQVCSDNLSFR